MHRILIALLNRSIIGIVCEYLYSYISLHLRYLIPGWARNRGRKNNAAAWFSMNCIVMRLSSGYYLLWCWYLVVMTCRIVAMCVVGLWCSGWWVGWCCVVVVWVLEAVWLVEIFVVWCRVRMTRWSSSWRGHQCPFKSVFGRDHHGTSL